MTAFLPLSRAPGFEATEECSHGGKEQQVLSTTTHIENLQSTEISTFMTRC
jgi:hypothetical protein